MAQRDSGEEDRGSRRDRQGGVGSSSGRRSGEGSESATETRAGTTRGGGAGLTRVEGERDLDRKDRPQGGRQVSGEGVWGGRQ